MFWGIEARYVKKHFPGPEQSWPWDQMLGLWCVCCASNEHQILEKRYLWAVRLPLDGWRRLLTFTSSTKCLVILSSQPRSPTALLSVSLMPKSFLRLHTSAWKFFKWLSSHSARLNLNAPFSGKGTLMFLNKFLHPTHYCFITALFST